MSVQDQDQIDFVSTHKDGYIILTISDHLEWDEKLEHLPVLQNKINSYLDFIESGQILTEYPNAEGKKIVIQIIAKFNPDEKAYTFLKLARETIQSVGHDLKIGFIQDGELIINEIT